jgi:hypothetical protein
LSRLEIEAAKGENEMKTRTLNRNQKVIYIKGSVKHDRPFAYSVQVVERTGASTQYFEVEGEDCADSKAAIQSAWKAGKAFVAELGEVKVSDSEYSATV